MSSGWLPSPGMRAITTGAQKASQSSKAGVVKAGEKRPTGMARAKA